VTTFITSDWHHSHKNIIKFCPVSRDFTDMEHMNDILVAEWNSKVKPSDTIYHLGDFSFSHSVFDVAQLISKLNGNKIFILGNHDQTTEKALDMLSHPKHHYMEVNHNKTKVVLFHFPIQQGHWNKSHYGSIHFHGHVHGNLNSVNEGTKRLDVGWDATGMRENKRGRILTWDEAFETASAGKSPEQSHHGVIL